jgi:hypothetical protein
MPSKVSRRAMSAKASQTSLLSGIREFRVAIDILLRLIADLQGVETFCAPFELALSRLLNLYDKYGDLHPLIIHHLVASSRRETRATRVSMIDLGLKKYNCLLTYIITYYVLLNLLQYSNLYS